MPIYLAKAELFTFPPKLVLSIIVFISVNDTSISQVSQAKNLGLILDSSQLKVILFMSWSQKILEPNLHLNKV